MSIRPFRIGEIVEYLLHIQPEKWRKAIVVFSDHRTTPTTYTLKSENGITTQQVSSNMRHTGFDTINWLEVLESTTVQPIEPPDKVEEARLVEMGMKVVHKLLESGDLSTEPDTDCVFCEERPALQNATICHKCYLKAVNELKPLSENELNILEADFFNWPRGAAPHFDSGTSHERRNKIEILRFALHIEQSKR